MPSATRRPIAGSLRLDAASPGGLSPALRKNSATRDTMTINGDVAAPARIATKTDADLRKVPRAVSAVSRREFDRRKALRDNGDRYREEDRSPNGSLRYRS